MQTSVQRFRVNGSVYEASSRCRRGPGVGDLFSIFEKKKTTKSAPTVNNKHSSNKIPN